MEDKRKKSIGGMLIPAGLFIGLGLGFLFDQLIAYLFIGLGIGFVLAFLFMLLEKKK